MRSLGNIENLAIRGYHGATDPTNPDTDGDGIFDYLLNHSPTFMYTNGIGMAG